MDDGWEVFQPEIGDGEAASLCETKKADVSTTQPDCCEEMAGALSQEDGLKIIQFHDDGQAVQEELGHGTKQTDIQVLRDDVHLVQETLGQLMTQDDVQQLRASIQAAHKRFDVMANANMKLVYVLVAMTVVFLGVIIRMQGKMEQLMDECISSQAAEIQSFQVVPDEKIDPRKLQQLLNHATTVQPRSAWTRIVHCAGPESKNRMDLTTEAIQMLAQTVTRVKICTMGDALDCVVSSENSFPIQMLRQGLIFSQKACGKECIASIWSNVNKNRLDHMWSKCGKEKRKLNVSSLLYHACGNKQGLHLGIGDKSECGWTHRGSDSLEVFIGD